MKHDLMHELIVGMGIATAIFILFVKPIVDGIYAY